ncbi:hypothetical protein IGS74_18860 [Aureimonas sp. OT7]|uniref:hypothetical protein n=1 Tax=Aureimonas sp. OT7 TaxID=2816454 RepID=UPI00178432BC|nr:hypothetical protein [Aureimonas sp. OT7]QOG06543.1 hypothetical protein IGS74_18860 [Aureimonas sp. OT7]
MKSFSPVTNIKVAATTASQRTAFSNIYRHTHFAIAATANMDVFVSLGGEAY